jgi:DedD protein
MIKGGSAFMDRRVKQRLVGASILVVLIVLIVPELFQGPKAPTPIADPTAPGPVESHNVVVDMATSKTTSTEEATSAASATGTDSSSDTAARAASAATESNAESAAAGAAPQAAAPSRPAPPTVVTLQAQPPAATLEKTSPSPRSAATAAAAAPHEAAPHEAAPVETSRHSWAVQLGSFASRVNAEKLQRNLKAQGYPATVSSGGSGRASRFRVRVAPLADRAAADRMVARLKQEGHAASVVAP